MITIICGITNQAVFDHCLGASLKRQNTEYKFITEDIKLKPAKARNELRLDTKYVAFIHQDVIMMEKSWLRRAEQFCDELYPKLGIAGVSGISWIGTLTGYIMLHMANPKKQTVHYYGAPFHAHIHGKPFKKPQLSMTLDGVVQIIPTEIFRKIHYDENLFQELSVDYCLQCKWKLNLNAYTLPLRTWHNVGRGGGRGWTFNDEEPRHGYLTPFGRGKMNNANNYIHNKWKGRFDTVYSTACAHTHFRKKAGRAIMLK